MLLVRVHAAVRHQPEQMQLPPALPRPLHRLHDRRVLLEFARRDQRIDARDVHLHNAPRADIQMTHFAVAHLPIRQPHKMFRRMNQRVGNSRSSLS